MPHRKPFITSINMGASGTNDCVAYIDKLEAFGNAYSPGKVVISASAGGYSNEQYFFEDKTGIPIATQRYGLLARDAVVDVCIAPEMVTFFGDGQHITSATNVAGYLSWGIHSLLGSDYGIDGTVNFFGE